MLVTATSAYAANCLATCAIVVEVTSLTQPVVSKNARVEGKQLEIYVGSVIILNQEVLPLFVRAKEAEASALEPHWNDPSLR